eukprot:scaffold21360_cov65-Phaeocystis_antarctica.AAC.10
MRIPAACTARARSSTVFTTRSRLEPSMSRRSACCTHLKADLGRATSDGDQLYLATCLSTALRYLILSLGKAVHHRDYRNYRA